ncbi:MAG: CsiV family protein [Wenzhouxiangellaceae bacterium]|nr:CsiV family protein [Wenzhouxiangellaceae bacterium]
MIRPLPLLLLSALLLPPTGSAFGRQDADAPRRLPGATVPSRPAEPEPLPDLYRVELVVLHHEGGRSDAWPAPGPAGAPQAADPLQLAWAGWWTERTFSVPGAPWPFGLIPDPLGARTVLLDATPTSFPAPWKALPGLSPEMSAVLTRLQRADGLGPVTWRAWIQPAPRNGRTPALRLHDGRPTVTHERPARIGSESTNDATNPPAAASPDRNAATQRGTAQAYRLDGTARLYRQNFLHLALDLSWSEPDAGLAAEPGLPAPVLLPVPLRGDGNGWMVHRLRQSRVVETGRFEYFDSPLFSVLARVTRYRPLFRVPEPEPEPEPAVPPGTGADSPGTAPTATRRGP